MDREEAYQIFDGAMLSDAGIKLCRGTSPRFELSQGGVDRTDWLSIVKEALIALGAPVQPQYPKPYPTTHKGKPYVNVWLVSRVCPLTREQRGRWYPNGIKVVPEDLVLTPIVAAHWFMGDGSSRWNTVKGTRTGSVSCYFAANSFTLEGVKRLETGLIGLGIGHISREPYKDMGARIWVHGNSVTILMDMIAPYVVESFSQKVKRPTRKIAERIGRLSVEIGKK